MKEKTRIGVVGIGGVGGYFGGLLASKYLGSKKIEIIFITKPETEKILLTKGLKLILDKEERIVFPDYVASNVEKIGKLDYLIFTVKSYDLEESLMHLKNCIKNSTIMLPLLNGIDSKEKIKKFYPMNEVLDGCVYLVSRLLEPGIVKQTGNIHSLYFGSNTLSSEKLKELEKIFLDAEIECHLSENVEQTIWEKFIFISSIASLTSFLNLCIGDILKMRFTKRH